MYGNDSLSFAPCCDAAQSCQSCHDARVLADAQHVPTLYVHDAFAALGDNLPDAIATTSDIGELRGALALLEDVRQRLAETEALVASRLRAVLGDAA